MHHIEKILLAVDFSKSDAVSLEHAAMLTRRYGAQLHALHVNVDSMQVYGLEGMSIEGETSPEKQHELEQRLADFVLDTNLPVVTVTQTGFSASHLIHDYVKKMGIDLVVVGTRGGSGIRRFFLGSVAAEIVRTAEVPVLIVGDDHKLKTDYYRRIMVGVDFSPASVAALKAADQIADPKETHISAIHVIDVAMISPYLVYQYEEEDRKRALEEFNKTMSSIEVKARVDTMVVLGRPHNKIVEHAKALNADLIVMGHRGLGLLDRWLLGSVADRVLRSAPCALLLHRDQHAEDPEYAEHE